MVGRVTLSRGASRLHNFLALLLLLRQQAALRRDLDPLAVTVDEIVRVLAHLVRVRVRVRGRGRGRVMVRVRVRNRGRVGVSPRARAPAVSS